MTQVPPWSNHDDTESYRPITAGLPPAPAEPGIEWARHVNYTISDQIRHWRKRRNLSAQQLADRCEELGYPIPRNVIANLETRRRTVLTVVELIVIALALNVPPALLLYPLGVSDHVLVAPRHAVTPWGAIKWFSGERRPADEMLGGLSEVRLSRLRREWEDANEPVVRYRQHDSLVNRYRYIKNELVGQFDRSGGSLDHRRYEVLREELQAVELRLVVHRQLMRDAKMVLPNLPVEIVLDEPPGQPDA